MRLYDSTRRRTRKTNDAKRVWKLMCEVRGIKFVVLLEASEENVRPWAKTELPGFKSYIGASASDISAAKSLGLPVYIYK